ncbi:MAG: prolipoprotein diacylglyceryl transferase, partial [Inquilinus sp.]|nr:prolipoprotein diacylglyceryl transferase [Inquilinus sp.]
AADPLQILMIWTGGMSFHGGLAGVIVAMVLFARRRGLAFLAVADIIATVAPIGLFFGRIANFVNAELFGRPTDLPWGIVFPNGGGVPRHPSQLYEAFLEGLVLLVILAVLARRQSFRRRPGMLAGIFLAGYGVARFLVEFARQPDAQFVEGTVWLGATMGQLLSLPMIAIGLGVLLWAARQTPARTA